MAASPTSSAQIGLHCLSPGLTPRADPCVAKVAFTGLTVLG